MSASDPSRNGHRSAAAEVGALARAGEEAFLSPRVVDQATFDQLAGVLRQLVESATAAGEALTRRTVESQRSLKALVEASPTLEARLEKAARASSALDTRLADLERLARQAAEQTQSVTGVDIKLDEMVRGKLASFQMRLDDAVAIALAKIAAAAEEASGAVRKTGQETFGRIAETRDDLEMLAGETLGRIRGAADAARDEVNDVGQRAVDRIIATTKGTTARVDELSDAAERLIGIRLDEGARRIERELERGQAKADAAVARLDEQMSPLIARASGEADRLEQRLEGLREAASASLPDVGRLEALCRRAGELDARDEHGEPAPGSLAAIVGEACELAEAVRGVGAELEVARKDAEGARAKLAESMDAAGGWLDRMVAQSESLQETLRQASVVCDAAEQALEHRRSELREAVEQPREDLQLESQRLAALTKQAAEARAAIEQMLSRCEQVIADLDAAGASVAREAQGAREAAERASRTVDLSRASVLEAKGSGLKRGGGPGGELGEQLARIADLVSTLAAQTGTEDEGREGARGRSSAGGEQVAGGKSRAKKGPGASGGSGSKAPAKKATKKTASKTARKKAPSRAPSK